MSRPEESSRYIASWVRGACHRAPWVVLALLLATLASLYYAISHLRIDTSREKMISPELGFRRDFERYREEFPQFVDNFVLVVDGETPERARAEALRVAQRLASRPELFGNIHVPRADEFLERHSLLFLDVDELKDLSDRLADIQPFLGKLSHDRSLRGLFSMLESAFEEKEKGSDVDLARLLTRMDGALEATLAGTAHRLSWQELMSDRDPTPDDRRQYVFVQPLCDYDSLFPVAQALDEVHEIRAELGLDGKGGARLRVTGGIALAHEELQTVARGAEWIVLLVLVMVGVVLFVGLRSARLVAATLITLVAGLSLTALFATTVVGRLNMISVVFAALYLGLGVDYAIHLCLRYQERVRAGHQPGLALQTAATDIGGSLVLCALTTALGFFAFVPTAYAGISELGLIAGTGMFISLGVTMTAMPALLTLMPLSPAGVTRPGGRSLVSDRMLELPTARRRPVVAASAALGLATIPALFGVRFDSNALHLRDPESESVRTFTDLLRTSTTPPWSITVVARDRAEARSLAKGLAGKAEIDKVVSLDSFVPERQKEKLAVLADIALLMGPDLGTASGETRPGLPEQVAAVRALSARLARYLASEAGRGNLPAARFKRGIDALLATLAAGSDQTRRALLGRLESALLDTLPVNLARLEKALETEGIGPSDLPPRLSGRWTGQSGTYRLEVFPRNVLGDDQAALERFVAATKEVAPLATGSPVLMLESSRAIVGAFRQALLLAMGAASLVLLGLLRDIVDVLLVLAPLLLAGLLTGATLALIDLPFNFANVIALPLLLGIGVDSGIHMVHRARSERSRNPLRTSSARGVVFSALTTTVSFGSLAASPHRGTASMGLLLTIGMAFVLVCTLVVLPALLAMSGRSRP
ncbi:MAG: MMPL family transporter [Planctomycetota bacterium]